MVKKTLKVIKPSKKPPVIWTTEEKKKLFQYLFGMKLKPNSKFLTTHIREAQKKVLPLDRRKSPTENIGIEEFRESYKKYIERRSIKKTVDKEIAVVRNKAIKTVGKKPKYKTELETKINELTHKVVSLEVVILDLINRNRVFTNQISDLKVEKEKLRIEFEEYKINIKRETDFLLSYIETIDTGHSRKTDIPPDQTTAASMPLTDTPLVPLTEKKSKMKILIVGANADQEQSIDKDFKRSFDLVYRRTATSDISQNAANSDFVVLMTKFINHGHYSLVKKYASGKILYANGASESVKELLRNIGRKAGS